MSKFNTSSPGTKTVNLAGGEAFSQSPELELVSILLTSFVDDKFYRTATEELQRLKDLIKVCDAKFVAKAAIYARTAFGMRSISHVVASELAKHIGTSDFAKSFYDKIVYRVDDMMEILSYHTANNGKVTGAMKKGFAAAIGRFDPYALGKYRGEGKGFKLIDVVNLVHPKPTIKNGNALELLVKGELKSVDTWEVELSKAGQVASSEDEKLELKKDVWVKLISEKKIKYFALLRNLRNIIQQAPEMIDQAIEMLTDEKLIKSSLVLPFRFTTAYDEIKILSDGAIVRKVLIALNKAIDISVSNVPKFDGNTLVVLDVSGSMTDKLKSRPDASGVGTSPAQIGSLFASVLVKANNADFMVFATSAKYVNVNTTDSTITIADSMRSVNVGGSTNFDMIWLNIQDNKYDRIIILSDEQGWVSGRSSAALFELYKKRLAIKTKLYSFDLQGYGSMQFPEKDVYCIAGFSEKTLEIMGHLEQDKNALINEIKKVSL